MLNLYNRKLLDDFNVTGIKKLIDEALTFTEQQASMNDALRKAILARLTLRKHLLSALESDLNPDQHVQTRRWKDCSELLPGLLETHSLSKPIENAFSIKIQRTLASSVPPRPIARTTFDEAHTFFGSLCRDAADVYHVLNYHGSSNILVRAQEAQAPSAC